MSRKFDAEAAIQQIALREGKTVEAVRTQMKIAMMSGLHSKDPVVQARWKKIPCKGEIPTLEELITYLADHAEAGPKLFGG